MPYTAKTSNARESQSASRRPALCPYTRNHACTRACTRSRVRALSGSHTACDISWGPSLSLPFASAARACVSVSSGGQRASNTSSLSQGLPKTALLTYFRFSSSYLLAHCHRCH